MSWVTNVILIFSLEEVFGKILKMEKVFYENLKTIETSPALININSWLEKNGQGTLDHLSDYAKSGGKMMSARIYGEAFNFLDIDNFIKVVKVQNWRAKKDVQLLIKDEEDSCFTMYRLTDN